MYDTNLIILFNIIERERSITYENKRKSYRL